MQKIEFGGLGGGASIAEILEKRELLAKIQ